MSGPLNMHLNILLQLKFWMERTNTYATGSFLISFCVMISVAIAFCYLIKLDLLSIFIWPFGMWLASIIGAAWFLQTYGRKLLLNCYAITMNSSINLVVMIYNSSCIRMFPITIEIECEEVTIKGTHHVNKHQMNEEQALNQKQSCEI